jgi:hypothetical protein
MDLFDLWVYGGLTKKFDFFFLGNFEVSLKKLLFWVASINDVLKNSLSFSRLISLAKLVDFLLRWGWIKNSKINLKFP